MKALIPSVYNPFHFFQEPLQFAVFRILSFLDQTDQFLPLFHQFAVVPVLGIGILFPVLVFLDFLFLLLVTFTLKISGKICEEIMADIFSKLMRYKYRDPRHQ